MQRVKIKNLSGDSLRVFTSWLVSSVECEIKDRSHSAKSVICSVIMLYARLYPKAYSRFNTEKKQSVILSKAEGYALMAFRNISPPSAAVDDAFAITTINDIIHQIDKQLV